MASRIVPTNIDVTYPIAGQDNDTKGFRDNFSSIRNNFTVASSEISSIQSTLSVVPTYTTVPISSTSIGTIGEIAADSRNFYVCIGTNSWGTIPFGVPLATFRAANLSASSNVTLTSTDTVVVLDSTLGGNIARANIFLPSNVGLVNGQTLTIASNVTVTSAILRVNGTNTSLYGNTATNAFVPNASFRWVYNSAGANWYRI